MCDAVSSGWAVRRFFRHRTRTMSPTASCWSAGLSTVAERKTMEITAQSSGLCPTSSLSDLAKEMSSGPLQRTTAGKAETGARHLLPVAVAP